MAKDVRKHSAWWGDFTLAEGQAGRWHVGPSTLWVYRLPREWRIVHHKGGDPLSETAEVRVPVPAGEVDASLDEVPAGAAVGRFGFGRTGGWLGVAPALADRPVVVRPETPLYVQDGEAVTLYVSTPLWLCFEAGAPPRLLQEFASYRPSDTWFGPNTRHGELCYGSHTVGRLDLEDMPFRLHRAVTPILIRNRAKEALLVERIQLPVQYLSLFQAPDDFLWTQALRLEHEREGVLAALHIDDGPPPEAGGAALVRGPRQTSHTSLIGRTFSSLFSKLKEV